MGGQARRDEVRGLTEESKSWSDLLRAIPMADDYKVDVFLAELERELDEERASWSPRKRRMMRLRRPWYRARWWWVENMAWRFRRHRPGDDW